MDREVEKIIIMPFDRIKGMVPLGVIDFLWPECCCPILLFVPNIVVSYTGMISKRSGTKVSQVYSWDDYQWWASLTPRTRKSVIKWLNEKIKIKKGLL